MRCCTEAEGTGAEKHRRMAGQSLAWLLHSLPSQGQYPPWSSTRAGGHQGSPSLQEPHESAPHLTHCTQWHPLGVRRVPALWTLVYPTTSLQARGLRESVGNHCKLRQKVLLIGKGKVTGENDSHGRSCPETCQEGWGTGNKDHQAAHSPSAANGCGINMGVAHGNQRRHAFLNVPAPLSRDAWKRMGKAF